MTVHATAVLEGDVRLGEGATVGAFSYLRGPIVVGAGTHIGVHCVIGTDGEHKTRAPSGVIAIGAHTIIRELTVIQRGTGDRDTTIGDGCYIMDHCHVAHDVVIADGVTLSPNVVLGGHTRVHEGATVGIGAITHQFSTVGAYAMIGMGAIVTRDVPPFCLVAGNPARFLRFNTHQLDAQKLPAAALRIAKGALHTDDARVAAHLERFTNEARRKLLPLEARADDA
jgi:UDP-N-acetylglucosamine acyltransferase